MRCPLCTEEAIDLGPGTLRKLVGVNGLKQRIIDRDLAGLRWCYQCLIGQIVAVVCREFRAWEKAHPGKPWYGKKARG